MPSTAHPLGRRPPTDWRHVEKYPLTAPMVGELAASPRPLAIGVNWYSAFDRPVKDSAGHYWIARDGNLGSVRGGHCVCLKQRKASDPLSWWDFYDQGHEGACVGFGWSRVMSQFNRERYDGRWLYHEAQTRDEWPGVDYEGTSVRAGGETLRLLGHRQVHAGVSRPADLSKGIAAYRWIRSIDDALEVLGYSNLGYVDVLNSWGRSYPHLVRLPVTVLERLWKEDGEIAVPTDR